MKKPKLRTIMQLAISFFAGAFAISIGWYLLIANMQDRPPSIPSDEKVDLDWELSDLEGELISLRSLSGGKPIFLNIWATWCGPCIGEMPGIEALHQDYGDKVAFVCVSEESLSVIRKFADRRRFNLPYYQRDALPEDFKTSSWPMTYIISSSGKALLKHRGSADWNHSSVREYLDTLLAERR